MILLYCSIYRRDVTDNFYCRKNNSISVSSVFEPPRFYTEGDFSFSFFVYIYLLSCFFMFHSLSSCCVFYRRVVGLCWLFSTENCCCCCCFLWWRWQCRWWTHQQFSPNCNHRWIETDHQCAAVWLIVMMMVVAATSGGRVNWLNMENMSFRQFFCFCCCSSWKIEFIHAYVLHSNTVCLLDCILGWETKLFGEAYWKRLWAHWNYLPIEYVKKFTQKHKHPVSFVVFSVSVDKVFEKNG